MAHTRTATAKQDWEGRAIETLASSGHRAGGARTAVVELLAEQDCCLSAQQIHDRLRSGGRGVGIASVYRALDVLEDLELIHRLEVGDGGSRYEPALPGGEHHHHVICDSCGEVTAFEDAKLEDAIEKLGGRLEHIVGAHDVVIHGTCRGCAPARRRS
ncbi:MAG: Fur family transcriptional regulator [Solirubrobacterales bacterium]